MDPARPEANLHDLRLRATQTLQLIGLVEVNRALYDTSDKNYNRKKTKSVAWKGITAAVLDIKPEEVTRLQSLQIQHKWKSLRTAYVRQRRLANPLAPYRYADLMSFLDPFLRRDESAVLEPSGFSAPFELDLNGDVTTEVAPATIKENCIDFFDPIEEDFNYDVQMLSKQSPDELTAPLSSAVSTNSESVESATVVGAVPVDSHDVVDELEMFFSQITRTIRKFSTRKTIELKMQIFNLVSQAELDELDATNK
ncbi:uncharacterized protein LOC131685596 [Topomyia yanbarensis]|uniref:uncharacterized protein LOC131685596 n=1 Tax=Topomyia yanbarensis TaxID=2498891 RepID=UPI00273B947F|nr:uncharacterized protein LOC131685596 [Topomyia yanbarensis]